MAHCLHVLDASSGAAFIMPPRYWHTLHHQNKFPALAHHTTADVILWLGSQFDINLVTNYSSMLCTRMRATNKILVEYMIKFVYSSSRNNEIEIEIEIETV